MITKNLNSGAFGDVYEANLVGTDVNYALKIIDTNKVKKADIRK